MSTSFIWAMRKFQLINMTRFTIDNIICTPKLSREIFFHLSDVDLKNCAIVNKTWYLAVTDTRSRRKLEISVELLENLTENGKKLENIVSKKKYATDLVIYGWSQGVPIPRDVYDSLFNSKLRVKNLVLRGRGSWDTCKCPEQSSVYGEQFDTVKKEDLTNLENIHITTTFCISSCALLDLVSRSPKLKTIRFHGIICKTDHNDAFSSKRFYSDIERIYWPWTVKKHMYTLTTLVRRHENITTFHSSAETTCDLLAADALPKVRYLSLSLSENWICKPGNYKKVYKYLQNIKYLSVAKNVEALEVRTFEVLNSCDDIAVEVERTYEDYQLTFWQQISKMSNLKYLAIYGSWELEKVCRLMAKYALQIEYLKINLMPHSVISAIDIQDDNPILSMAEGVRNLRKLPQLRSLHYICYEKLHSVDAPTVLALKELTDLVWAFDIKTGFTDEVEDLLNNVMKRGNQLGKTYNISLHIQTKPETNLCNLLVKYLLRFPSGTDVRSKLSAKAEYESSNRYGKPHFENYHIWGLEQTSNCRDKKMYDMLTSNWKLYNEKFHIDPTFT